MFADTLQLPTAEVHGRPSETTSRKHTELEALNDMSSGWLSGLRFDASVHQRSDMEAILRHSMCLEVGIDNQSFLMRTAFPLVRFLTDAHNEELRTLSEIRSSSDKLDRFGAQI